MKKRIFASALVSLALLTACGAKDPQPHGAGHGGQHAGHQADAKHEGHANHGAKSDKDIPTKVAFSFTNTSPKSSQKEELEIKITDDKGSPVADFEVGHERKLHLIVVSKDLAFFDHLHPEFLGNGTFKVNAEFPQGGEYKLIADYIPVGGNATSKSQWVNIAGPIGSSVALQPDQSLTKVVDGKEITLSFAQLQAGKEVTMNWNFKDAATKQPIANLQPYLGAVGHVVIVSADAEQYLHNHPLDEKATGPDAKFGTVFPSSGVYKIWGQFKHNDQVFTVPFVVEVP